MIKHVIRITNDNLNDFIEQIATVPRDVFLKQAPKMIDTCYADRYFTIVCYLEKFIVHFDSSQLYNCIRRMCRDYYDMLGRETAEHDITFADDMIADDTSEYNNYMINEIMAGDNKKQFDMRVDALCGIRYADYNIDASTAVTNINITNDTNTTNTTNITNGTSTINTQINRILHYLSLITYFDAYICNDIIRAISHIHRPACDGPFGYSSHSYRMEVTDIMISNVLVDPVSVAIFTHRGITANIDLFISILFDHRTSGYIENVIICTIIKHNKQLVWNVLAAYVTRTTVKHLHHTRRSVGHRHYKRYNNTDSIDVTSDQRQITWRDEVIRICSNAINELTYDDIVKFEHNDKLTTMFIHAFMRTYNSTSFAEVIIEQLLKKGLSLDIIGNNIYSLRTALQQQGYHRNKKIHNAIMALG